MDISARGYCKDPLTFFIDKAESNFWSDMPRLSECLFCRIYRTSEEKQLSRFFWPEKLLELLLLPCCVQLHL
ncbi:hypothetical protein ACET3Z_006618 [Daucus carota]